MNCSLPPNAMPSPVKVPMMPCYTPQRFIHPTLTQYHAIPHKVPPIICHPPRFGSGGMGEQMFENLLSPLTGTPERSLHCLLVYVAILGIMTRMNLHSCFVVKEIAQSLHFFLPSCLYQFVLVAKSTSSSNFP